MYDKYDFKVSASGVRRLIKKFKETGSVANKKRTNEHNFLINSLGALKINELIHRNPEITVTEIKRKLNLIAAENTINSYVVKLGWTRKKTRFVHAVSKVNKQKRLTYCSLARMFNDQFDDTILADEATVQLSKNMSTRWIKVISVKNKVQKYAHSLSVHVWGSISKKGASNIVIFTGKTNRYGFIRIIKRNLLPFIMENFPFEHRYIQDNAPYHDAGDTQKFMSVNGINHFPTPAQSPVV